MKLCDIGNTALVELSNLAFNGNRLFAKCEFQNPTGSHKDRTFLHIINTLERENKIAPGMTLVDCSTGNGGAALAWIGQQKGYRVVVFMPEGMTAERLEQIRMFGGTVVETPKEKFLNGSVEAALNYVETNQNTFYLNQAGTTLNMKAWFSCGQEIIAQLREKDVSPDYFVCSIGTGGTFSGIAKVLKQAYPDIKTIGIEVDKSAPVYAKRKGITFKHHSHNLMGLGAGVLSINTDLDLIDEIKVVNGELAWERMRAFIDSNGLGIGPTCGSNIVMSESLMEDIHNKIIVTLFFDSAWKYKSRWDGIYPEYSK
ncbi:cysteine synthase family protein [Musicola paradisiaca]|uniref:cysteine synthase n=1 Tax=Musicola paradisiaca (strain Ech703) TaxID=579405 RepID=C6C7L1_MUSP7|nr:cysteine synthase family protein [Musicola paradisiaca]ACS85953.1 Pyridoxal-5'-phosphate-dependent protein beta subunit [Musicola paradisiaca Ech703]